MKLCECGCGQPTALMTRTQAKLGLVTGEPRRYIHGHCGPNREEVRSRRAAGVKMCGGCKAEKPFEAFAAHAKRVDGLQVNCRECMRLRVKEDHLKRKYGLTLEARAAMLEEQNWTCPACGKQLVDGPSTVVDHCHKTGVVRGLLCGPCNVAAGQVGDDPDRLRRLADYLEASTPAAA